MRGIGKRRSRSEDASDSVPVAVFDGSLRNLYDTTGLDVTLSLFRTESAGARVTVISDGGELGTWPVASVAISSFDSTSYEFYTDGDLLLFTPIDLVGFHASPFVVGLPPDTEQRKRRKAKTKQTPAADTAPTKKKTTKSRRVVEKKPARKKKPPLKKTPVERVPPVMVEEQPSTEQTSDAGEIPPDAGGGPEGAAETPAADVSASSAVADPPVVPADDTSEPVDTPPKNGGMSNVVWIRVLDMARRRDIFDLNRVPVDRRLRGQEHQHTWDHRVATKDGLGSRLCTICGKFRRSS